MYGTKLCLGTIKFGLTIKEQIKLFKETGFDGFFVDWTDDTDIRDIKEYADSIGMIFQSIHAPFGRAADMWTDNSDDAVDELLRCLKDCSENDVPIMVCHTIIGFDKHTPNKVGIENYRKIALEAKKVGVKIAFENTEGEEYLRAVMDGLSDCENIGFCWDTGHEMCYNHSRNMLEMYGDRLICTHLNDNLGIRDFGGEITWLDDLHLLPFDGTADWAGIVRRLNLCGYDDILTFELQKQSKPGRHENDVYDDMTVSRYVCEAYKRACRVAALKMNDKRNGGDTNEMQHMRR